MTLTNELELIARKERTDKAKRKHFYTKWYDLYFKIFRYKKINLLEIGVKEGRSICMWGKYFKNANIYGLDIDKECINVEVFKKFKIFIGDQTDIELLGKINKHVKNGFDIIIDDGSHITSDQKETFVYLFDKLNLGGIYVIEDLQTSYRQNYKRGKCENFVDFLKKRIDDVNYNGRYTINNFDVIKKDGKKLDKLNKYEKTIESIHFYAGICFVFKRDKK